MLDATFESAQRWNSDHFVLGAKVRSPSVICPYSTPNILLTHRTLSLASRARTKQDENMRGIAFASAYLKHGFHEDDFGFNSGLLAVYAVNSTEPELPAATACAGVLTETEISITSKSVRPPFTCV